MNISNVDAASVGENFEDVLESVPDQGAEEYVRQFSPDNQTEDSNQEAFKIDHDDDEEDDSQLIEHLKRFLYDQTSQPKNKDIIFYYDIQEKDFIKVKIVVYSSLKYSQYLHMARCCRTCVTHARIYTDNSPIIHKQSYSDY